MNKKNLIRKYPLCNLKIKSTKSGPFKKSKNFLDRGHKHLGNSKEHFQEPKKEYIASSDSSKLLSRIVSL